MMGIRAARPALVPLWSHNNFRHYFRRAALDAYARIAVRLVVHARIAMRLDAYARIAMRRSLALILCCCFSWIWPRNVAAETFSLGYLAPSGCPSAGSLIQQVLARANGARLDQRTGAHKFEVQVARNDPRTLTVTLILHAPGGKRSLRVLDGSTCEEVASAVAVILALRLDPSAKSGPLPPTSAVDAADVLPENAQAQAPVLDKSPANASPLASVPRPHPGTKSEGSAIPKLDDGSHEAGKTSVPLAASVVPPAEAWRRQFLTGAHAEWSTGLAPGLGLPRFGAHVSFRTRSGPIASLLASASPSARYATEQGVEANLFYFGAATELGWNVWSWRGFALDALVVTSFGGLRARGQPGALVELGQSSTALWLSTGPGVAFGSSTNWGGWAVALSVPLGLVRPKFIVESTDATRITYLEVPPAAMDFSVRLSLRVLG